MASCRYKIGSLPLLSFIWVEALLLTYTLNHFCHCGGSPSCIVREKVALLAIKADINSTHEWLSSWTGDDCCRWRGVSCNDATGHVVELSLRYPYSHDLEFPDIGPSKLNPSLSNLTHLKYLDLSMNNFQGAPIPGFIAYLKHLEYLNLSFAMFNGTIPLQLGDLTNLQYLDLQSVWGSTYSLIAPELQWLSHITSLRHLDLSGVDLSAATGWVQDINMLPSLSVLRLRSANLGSIAPYLPHLNLTSLVVLDLSSNYFNATIPQWVFNISSLVELNLNVSGLHGEIPLAIGSLHKIRRLDLSLNFITGEIPYTLGNLSRLEYLDLSSNQLGGKIPETVGNLSLLSYFSLSMNGITGEIPDTVGSIENLRYLDLSSNSVSGSIPESISNLRNLTNLWLTGNQITGSIPGTFGKLGQLQRLDISFNNISSSIPESFGNLSSLQQAYMLTNSISGEIPHTFGKLYSLYHLELQRNNLGGIIPSTMGNLCNLDHLDLSENKIGGSIAPLIDGLARCISNKQTEQSINSDSAGLTRLILGKNRLNGTVPENLGRLTSLITLDLSFNSFKDSLRGAHFVGLVNLSGLDLSFNSFEMRMSQHWIPPFNATGIRLCGCKIGPEFPAWLRTQKELSDVCISDAGISGTIPLWFWDLLYFYQSSLNISHNSLRGQLPGSIGDLMFDTFDVSYNNFEGLIPQLNPYVLFFVHLSNNNFSGPIPQSFATATSDLQVMYLSHNSVSGSIPPFFCNITGLRVLDLSSNNLSGEIPQCWDNSSWLSIINFSNNSLSGRIPHSLGSLTKLLSLHLGNNGLQGMIPLTLMNCKQLVTLDLGMNYLTGSIPAWIGGTLSLLRVLNLRQNLLEGDIPAQLSNLSSLQVLDLSHNHLIGGLPQSLGNFGAMIAHPENDTYLGYDDYRFYFFVQGYSDYFYRESILMSKNGTEYVYSSILSLVTSIDVSSNNLSGEIPQELTNLSRLLFLNMSNNHFSGKIPENIGALNQLQSLDLSTNNLSGNIPPSISAITFLSQLNISHNNLTGKIPSGTQLQSFDPSVYDGNPGLCGPPLPVGCPGNNLTNGTNQMGDQEGGENVDGSEMVWIFVGFAPGFVVGFWLFMAATMIKQSIRVAYVQLLDKICDWVYRVASWLF